MADNQHTADSAAAQAPGTAPTQPAASHQPAEQAPQTGGATPYAQQPSAYGHAYQPYHQYGFNETAHAQAGQQQAQATGAYSQPAYHHGTAYPHAVPAPLVPETKLWINTKSGLHAAGAVLSICALGMGLSLIRFGDIAYLAGIACAVPAMALIWSAAELIVLAVHKFQKGIHPGGQVAACLILWMAAATIAILEGLTSSTFRSHCSYAYDSRVGYIESNCNNPYGAQRPLWAAITAFTSLLWLVYFTLFIYACIDTSKRNSAKRVVMMVNPATYWGYPAQGWQQMPQQLQQGQHMTAPQRARTRGSVTAHQQGQQDIPLQNRTPSPAAAGGAPVVVDEKGKGPEQQVPGGQEQRGDGVQEFYTPGAAK
ncbi:hypothetical protein ACRE_049270 [Hapsidospora chrysogenum ATCC 11550]|uniref:MARVEL domain-containing protein n=1 Tax=Hapsidospora chrysogenum (strain ATCC 11550 / CBS 779.69 / DSM 880 / IAM 14645 / JCM 23072 / IMI 49137) TaxID=857340 RepID=A0A086T4J2_HAPC1|nr:hypothetical protein ACRE_049270 [Hapsidospora chrysogenum ATCC 11550]